MGGMMGGFGGYGTFGWIGFILNLVITLGVIIGVILLIVWAVRRRSNNGQVLSTVGSIDGPISSPREILNTRYARGEITREQYKEMIADLDLG
ncbi:MAG: SHOCT domain-containing protein [Candidatus Hermodarchaeia archaeon]|jgi:putative membrane protein